MGIILILRWTHGVKWIQYLRSSINFLPSNSRTIHRIHQILPMTRWIFQICLKLWVLQCFLVCLSKCLKICSICLHTNRTFNWLPVVFNNKWLTNNLDSYRKHLSCQILAKFKVRLPFQSRILTRNQQIPRNFSSTKLNPMTPSIVAPKIKNDFNNHWRCKAQGT